VARIVSLQGGSYPLAGVMIRETLGATSTYEFMYFQKSNGFELDNRASTGGGRRVSLNMESPLCRTG